MNALKIGISVVDFSALPDWPHRFSALADMHRQIDRHHAVRQAMGAALVPPICRVHSLGGRLVLLSRASIEAEP